MPALPPPGPATPAASALHHARQARAASGWGQFNVAGNEMSRAYHEGFQARVRGEPLSEEAWSAMRSGFQRRPLSPCSGYSCEWSPMITGSGIRGQGEAAPVDVESLADQAAAETLKELGIG